MKRRKSKRPTRWTPFELATMPAPYVPLDGETTWMNDLYQVNVRPFVSPIGRMLHLSIKRRDKEIIRDWRELQRIKNELVSPDAEAVELFPAESRLVDTANQYHLWIPIDFSFAFGFSERLVSDATTTGAKQRLWSDEDRPEDCKDDQWMRDAIARFVANGCRGDHG